MPKENLQQTQNKDSDGKQDLPRAPLPPPEMLKVYNEAVADGAERILRMVELQADHRMEKEKIDTSEHHKHEARGMTYAFRICMAFLVISALLIWYGHDLAGTALGTLDLIGLTAVFILGRRFQKG